MNALAVMLAITLTTPMTAPNYTVLASVRAPLQVNQPDRWFGEDKLKHAFLSCALVGFAHAGARAAGVDGTPAVAFAVSVSAAAGVWKELRDRTIDRPFSLRDLAWDAVGIGAGALLVARAR